MIWNLSAFGKCRVPVFCFRLVNNDFRLLCEKLFASPKICFIVYLFSFILLACGDEQKKREVNSKNGPVSNYVEITAASIAGNFSSQSALKFDSASINSFFIQYPLLAPFQKNIRNFYQRRNFAYAWHDQNGLIQQAWNLYNRIQNLQQEGVQVKVPYLNKVDSLVETGNISNKVSETDIDLMLTSYYFFFAEKIWVGLDESQTRKIDWFLPRKKVDYEIWLDSLLVMPGGFSKTEEPVYRQYNLLKTYLSKYTKLNETHAWNPLVAKKNSYRLGDSAVVIQDIKKRLHLLGDMNNLSKTNLFDLPLETGVKKFQYRFGMKPDGVIGQQMLRELNTPLNKRIEQIIVNIERSRWLPDQVKGKYLAVNIPEFKLHAYHDDSLLWSMNVVVGKAVHKTVVFSGNLKYVVFSPYWNVPPGILKNEVLPGIKRNNNYLASHHMEWNGGQVRQKPGPWNALGQVKFLFPNSYSIYLHDTPSKSLFKEERRAFSHGCIRVAEPKELAAYLLNGDANWNEQKIITAMNSGKEHSVTLKESMPVFIAYFTSWVDRTGLLNFREDIYERDSRLAELVVHNDRK